MNCSRFRFLIQQKFDLDLAPQEERIVLAHLESCESCAKFYHQLQQVILAAEEAALPDEILPANEEQLARMIMSQLPATKASPFAFITNLFQKKAPPPPMEDTRVRRGPAGKQAAGGGSGSGSAFPHRSSSAVKDAPMPATNDSKYKGPKSDEFAGASNRLRAMNKADKGDRNIAADLEAEQRELQSTTLGAKFGKAVPVPEPVETPLTLAESIRKKISEGAKPVEEGGMDAGGGEENFDDQYDNQQDNYDDGFGNHNEQGMSPQPAQPGMQGFNQGMMQQMGQGMQQMQPPSPFGQPAAMGAPAFSQPAAAPNAPVVGSWGKPSSTQSVPAQQIMPPQPYLAERPAQAAQPAASGQPAGWGTTWDNAQAPAAPAQAAPMQPPGGGWGSPAPSNGGWNQAPVAQPPAVQAMQPQASPPAWGAPAPVEAPNPPAPAFDASPAQAAPAWGQPMAAPAASAAPPAPAPAPAAPAQSGGWGSNGGGSDSWDTAGSQRGWGQTGADVPKPAAPAPVQQAPQPAPSNDSWGQPAAQAAWGQTAGTVNSAPVPAAPAVDAQQAGWGAPKPQGAWGNPAESNDWSAAQNTAQADVAQPQVISQSQIATTPATPQTQAPAPVPPAPRTPPRPAWSLESEQIETGTWQAFSPSGEGLGAKAAPAPKKIEDPLSADPLSIDDRWSTPIQSRPKTADAPQPGPALPQPSMQQGFAPPVVPPPMPAPGTGGLEFPNYSPDALKEAEPQWADQNAPQPAENVQQQPSLQQSVMQKLNDTLDESAGGKAGGQQDSWELSIQEKLQAQQRALAGASMQQLAALPVPPSMQEQAPAQSPQDPAWGAPASNNAWGVPQQQPAAPQAAMQQSFQPAPAPAPAAPAQPEQKSSLFSLDDQAIDQLFNENLKLKNAGSPAGAPTAAAAAVPPAPAPAPAPAQPWTPAPTTWAPEPQQPAPAPVEPSQFAQPQPGQQGNGWGDQAGQPKISYVNAARPSAPAAPYNPGDERRGQPGGMASEQFAPPAMPQPAPAPAPSQPQAAAQNQQGLFNLDDKAMDQLFNDNLGVGEATRAVGSNNAPPAPVPQQVPQPAPAPMQNGATSGGWAQPAAPNTGWANPAQPAQPPAQFAPPQPAQQPVPQQAPQQAANSGWGMPQQQQQQPMQPQLPPQQPQAPQQPPMPQQPAQGGGWGQAAATGGGWGQQQPAAPQPRIGAPAEPGKPRTGLFSIDDSVIDSIFADNLGVREGQQIPKGNVNDAVNRLNEAAAQQNQQMQQGGYGEASYDSPAPVKVEGVGRLDSRVDNTADQNSGRIASIGKFLLDQKDLEKIGNITEADLTDSSMRILTTDAASELQQLLQHIGQQKSVIGSVIIGHDGLLIANTLPPDFDAESMGQFALGIYMNTSTTVTKLGHEHIHQFVGRTPRGYIVIADFGGGLLVTISEGSETDVLIPLMRSITQLVAQ